MLTHKEFYIWLEGYLYGKVENKNIDVAPIVEKMSQVKEDKSESINIQRFDRIPVPVNPLPPNGTDPYRPPFEVYCETKQQLND